MRVCFFFFMFSYDAKPHKAKPNAADYTDFGIRDLYRFSWWGVNVAVAVCRSTTSPPPAIVLRLNIQLRATRVVKPRVP